MGRERKRWRFPFSLPRLQQPGRNSWFQYNITKSKSHWQKPLEKNMREYSFQYREKGGERLKGKFCYEENWVTFYCMKNTFGKKTVMYLPIVTYLQVSLSSLSYLLFFSIQCRKKWYSKTIWSSANYSTWFPSYVQFLFYFLPYSADVL